MAELNKVNQDGREVADRLAQELVVLREGVATHLRYLDGEVIAGLRDGRHTPEVAANIAEHQSRSLRTALERTGPLRSDGTAGPWFSLPGGEDQ